MELGTQKAKAVILKDNIVVVQGLAYSDLNPTMAAKTAFDLALKQVNLQLQESECSSTSGLMFKSYGCRCAGSRIFCEDIYEKRAEIIGGG